MLGLGKICGGYSCYRSKSSFVVITEQLGYVESSGVALDGSDLLTESAGKHTESRRQHLPDASAVLCLQGKLWQAHCDTNKAIECYAEALKLNPFMWDAFLGLCDLGKC